MPEMNDNDLRRLFQAAGYAKPERDLTDRIMARVAVTRIAEPVVVPPLISKRAWVTITIAAGLFVLCAVSLSGLGGTSNSLPWMDRLLDSVARFKMPDGAWPQWTIGLSVLALFFALLGNYTERRMSRSA
ncbi:MAG: hypothetical protein IPM12_08865 [Flavobacteriales bacterium]|nr:hypothetical protein [Flavobacteriales bacterium]